MFSSASGFNVLTAIDSNILIGAHKPYMSSLAEHGTVIFILHEKKIREFKSWRISEEFCKETFSYHKHVWQTPIKRWKGQSKAFMLSPS